MGLAVGVEQMGKMGLLGAAAKAAGRKRRCSSRRAATATSCRTEGVLGTGLMPGVFAQAGMEYARSTTASASSSSPRWPRRTTPTRRSTRSPSTSSRSASRRSWRAEMMAYPNTLLMCCPTGDGAAAVVVVSDGEAAARSARRHAAAGGEDLGLGADHRPVAPSGQVQPDVNTLTRNAADQAYEQAGVGPEDLDLVELHDCFATAELVHYDNLRLCEPGRGRRVHRLAGPWRDGGTPGQRVRRPHLQGPSARRHRASPTSTRSPPTCGARRATGRSTAPGSA